MQLVYDVTDSLTKIVLHMLDLNDHLNESTLNSVHC
jgi:hypothetical protein